MAEYPGAVVRLACSKCPRHGQYRKARLVAKHGAELPLPEMLGIIAADCPRMRSVLETDRCGVHYLDLGKR